MSTSSFSPKLSDGALLHYQLLSQAEPELLSEFKSPVHTTTYKPTHLISLIEKYIGFIVKHIAKLENNVKDEYLEETTCSGIDKDKSTKYEELQSIQKIYKDVTSIRNKIIHYSVDLYYGNDGIDNDEDENKEPQREYFVDIPANEGMRGNGRKSFCKGYSYNPNYSLPKELILAPCVGEEIYKCAHRAAIALYKLYLATVEFLFEIKNLQLKELVASNFSCPIDTYYYDFEGVCLPNLTETTLNHEIYETLEDSAKKLLQTCEENTNKIVNARKKKFPIIEQIILPKPIDIAKEKIYQAIKKIVDKNPTATTGISAFHKIIYDKKLPGGTGVNNRLKSLLAEASNCHQRRVLCCFTPGRTDATKKLYTLLNEVYENYYNESWILARTEQIETFLAKYYLDPKKSIEPICTIESKDGILQGPFSCDEKASEPSIEMVLKKKVYHSIEKLVRRKSNHTRGIAEFFKIIEQGNGRDWLATLKEISNSAKESSQRKVCCGLFSPPLRSTATQQLYDAIADIFVGPFTEEKANVLIAKIEEQLNKFEPKVRVKA